ncbi:MAG: antitoxin [Propionibacteriaceae bacterium]|nr:antitoxin [Propionibacteriaceae bacterium]
MPDLLIRDFPSDELRALDDQARRLGLSRVEYLRRQLVQAAHRGGPGIGAADLVRLGEVVSDLADVSVMDAAWS